jgi:flagellar hook-length control protein FliK
MLTTNQSTRAEQPLQGVLASKNESKSGNDLPEKSSFSKLFSSMKLGAASEAPASISPVEVSVLTGENSEDVALSVIQQLPTLDAAFTDSDSHLPAALSLLDSEDVALNVVQKLPALDAASNYIDSNSLTALSVQDSEGVALSVMQQLPALDMVANDAGNNSPFALNLLDSEGVSLSVGQALPGSEQLNSDLSALGIEEVDGNINMPFISDLQGSETARLSETEIDNPILAPVIDAPALKSDSEVLIPSSAVSNNAAINSELIESVSGEALQNLALNQSTVGKENSASVQLNSGISNAASNSVTNWGTQTHAAMASGDAQIGAQQSQPSAQGGQNGQAFQGQSGQQQAMMFAQFIKEGKVQALEQQAAVRGVDESALKSEGKDLLGGAEIASTDRRGLLPLGLQSIPQPLKHPQWGQALGQRVVFMANNSMQQAQITLNPEKLGHIQVTLQLDKDQKMNVSLNAKNGITRESMENALPKLREMLEQAGIALGSMDVSDQKQFSDNDSDKPTSVGVASNNAVEEEDAIIESSLSTVKTTDNIVDYYA